MGIVAFIGIFGLSGSHFFLSCWRDVALPFRFQHANRKLLGTLQNLE